VFREAVKIDDASAAPDNALLVEPPLSRGVPIVPTLSSAVDSAELERHLRAIARTVRLSGSPGEAEAFDYIETQLRAFGYDVNRYACDALIGYPLYASLTVLDPFSAEIAVNGYSLSPATGPDGIAGELVYAGSGQAADYHGRDVRGKIVLSDGLAMPGKEVAAAAAGAIGQIHINDEHIHEMCISPVWGAPTPETADMLPMVPAVAVTSADGARLKVLLEQGPVLVRLTTRPFREWVKIPVLTGDLPGVEEDRYILFSGHVDSWHYGAMDNGTANATQVEVARLLAERRGELRRGVRLAFWSGHSHGRYAGSAWYADAFWHDLHERCVCHVNIDSVGAKGASVLSQATTMAETYQFGRTVMAETAGAALDYRRISRSSDQSFWGHGIPTLFAALSEQAPDNSPTGAALAQLVGGGPKSGGLGWWWHTTEDTLDKISPQNLRRDAGIYAEAMWRLCTLDRLPFDPAAASLEMADAIDRYHEQAAGTIDLSPTRDQARDLAAAIRDTATGAVPPEQANELILGLSRILIPVNYTRSGPFDQDLALASPPVPGLADTGLLAQLPPSSDAFYFLRTRLTRQRNRVEHALREAARLLR
jgi:hypothetical protein